MVGMGRLIEALLTVGRALYIGRMSTLEPVPEDWASALAVVAHPDDMEYGAAAAVARWTGQGKRITYVLVTDGEAGISTMDPAKAGPVRRAEQVAACRAVGVEGVEFLGLPDGLLEETIALRSALCEAIWKAETTRSLTELFLILATKSKRTFHIASNHSAPPKKVSNVIVRF